MVIWSGLGFIVALIGVFALVLTEKVSEALTSDPHFYQHHHWLITVAMSLAALLTYGLHYFLGRRAEKTAEGAAALRRHTLFFVAVRWWPVIFIIVGIAAVMNGFSR